MSQRLTIDTALDCTIRAVGTLDAQWSPRLGGLQVRATAHDQPIVELSGRMVDQAALFGVLLTLYDLGLPLISVACGAAQGPSDVTTPPPGRTRPRARDVSSGK